MAASTADRFNLPSTPIAFVNMPMAAAAEVFANTCVMVIDGTGGVLMAADTANGIFMGMSRQHVDNSAGLIGVKDIEVTPIAQLGAIEFDAVSPDDSWDGQLVYFVDDHIVALAGTTTHDVVAGRVLTVTKTGASGKVLVDVADRQATVHA